MSYYDDVMSDILGDDWEKWICPFKGGVGNDLCYVDRNSDECRKCEEEAMKYFEKDGKK